MLKSILFLAATASALVIQSRDVTTVLNNLKKIDTDTNGLTSAVKSWDGTLFGALSISSAEQTLDSDVKSATTDAGKEAKLSSTDSKSVVTYVSGTLGPDSKAALAELEARKADADSAGITSTVESGLKTLKTDIDSLGKALGGIVSSDQTAGLSSALSAIDGYFATAITDYSS